MSDVEREPMPELRERAEMNDAQRAAIENLCNNYGVEFDPNHYYVYPDNSWMCPGWAEGQVGGPRHISPEYGTPEEPRGNPTIYIGVSPEGEVHS